MTPAQSSTPAVIDRAAIERASGQRREPAWLLEKRLAAFDRYQSLPAPTERSEGWRRTDLSAVRFDFAPLEAVSPSADAVSTEDAARGVIVGRLDSPTLAAHGDVIREAWSRVHGGLSIGKYSALAEAAWEGGAFVFVPDGVEVSQPVRLEWRGWPFPRLLAVLGKGSRLVLRDWHRDSGAPIASVVDLIVGDGAHLTYVHIQDDQRDSVSMSHQRARLGRDAKLVTLNFAIGSRLARADVEVELAGQGAESDMLGLVFGENDQQFDFHTLQGHRAPDTRSDLLFKSALDDRSHSTYTGIISIGKDAPRSQAYQANRNLLLSGSARADTEPKLEILIDDVARCTHGATVGPVDEEQLFYLRSRGLDADTATRTIVDGFFREVFEKVGDERVTADLAGMIAPHVDRLASA